MKLVPDSEYALIIRTETPDPVLAQACGIIPHPAIDVVAPRIGPEKFQLPGNVLCVLTSQNGGFRGPPESGA